jgi:hypothetical protein
MTKMRAMPKPLLTPLLLTLVLLGSAGCGPKPHWATDHAAKVLDCPTENIVVTPNVSPFYHEIAGCGRNDAFMEICLYVPNGSGGQASSCKLAVVSDLVRMVSFEMGCPENELQAVRLDQDTMGISGCDHRATAKPTLNGWVLNTISSKSE